ncbi:Tetratricopeptide repeat (TPR)-like superfamily protein [Raphanus sativus]|nr:Tetratricopeptide repeat (TPR)-like superfamily protein [Raphanus sativus]
MVFAAAGKPDMTRCWIMVRKSTISPERLRLYCSGHIICSFSRSLALRNLIPGYFSSHFHIRKEQHDRHYFTSAVSSQDTLIDRKVFDEMPNRDNKTVESSFMFIRDLLRSSMVRAEAETPRSIHCFALKSGFLQDLHASSQLLTLYGKAGDFASSLGLFSELKVKDVIAWNSVITALNRNGRSTVALGVFVEMIQKGTEFDSTTLLLALSALSSLSLSKVCPVVHCLAIEAGLVSDSNLCNALMNLYAQGEDLSSAECVFTRMEQRDIVSWNTIVTKCLASGQYWKSLKYFKSMCVSGQEADNVTFSSVISSCASLEEISLGESFHGLVIRSGYVPEAYVSVANSIISMYAKCGDIDSAETVFENLLCKDVISWNAILNGFASNGMFQEAFGVFKEMQSLNRIQPDIATVVTVTSICGDRCLSLEGRAIHGYTLGREMQSRALVVVNSLIDMYGKCGLTKQADLLFKITTDRDLVSWNSMISAFVQNGFTREAKSLFKEVVSEYSRSKFSLSTVLAILPSCCSSDSLIFGKSVHCWQLKLGFGNNILSANSVINMYIGCRDLTSAFLLLETISETRDLASWNSVIYGCASNGHYLESLRAFQAMSHEGKVSHDMITLLGTISACGNLGLVSEGRCFHGLAIKTLIESETQLQNTLITMYGRCKDIDSAVKVFGLISDPNLCSWNCVISALSQNKAGTEAVQLFRKLEVEPNEITFVGLLSASAQLWSTGYGVQAHCYLIRRGFQANPFISAALVDMYSSCGRLETGVKVFRNSGVRSIAAWNSLICAYGFHGKGEKAMELFSEMSVSGMEPNKSTFISLLSACSHSDGGKFGVKPVTEHRVCVVDMLGRAGKLREAYEFIKESESHRKQVYGELC